MFSHVMVGTNDIERAKRFYDAVLAVLGAGEPYRNQNAIGFKCSSPEQVRQFHDTAVAHGGTSIEDPPGLREGKMGAMHLAYVRDPDGNKLCALHRPR
jgi:catechol 2,3-dioxygenase-like lactoylglutathione lyase family enzyme